MIRLRQTIKRQHSKHCRQRRYQNRQLKCNRDECWPAIQRAAPNIDRIVAPRQPVLHQETTDASDDSADEHNHWDHRPFEFERIRESLNRIRTIRIHPRITGFASPSSGRDQRIGPFELGHEAVQRMPLPGRAFAHWRASSSPCFASSSLIRAFISAIEIIGRNLTKRNMQAAKNPMVPIKVAQSQMVGLYMPHDDVRKSRLRLVITITKRSSHIPTRTNSEATKTATVEFLTRLIHSTCGIITLQAINAQ